MKIASGVALIGGLFYFVIGVVMGCAHESAAPAFAFGGLLVGAMGIMLYVVAQPDPEENYVKNSRAFYQSVQRAQAERKFKENMAAHLANFNNKGGVA